MDIANCVNYDSANIGAKINNKLSEVPLYNNSMFLFPTAEDEKKKMKDLAYKSSTSIDGIRNFFC